MIIERPLFEAAAWWSEPTLQVVTASFFFLFWWSPPSRSLCPGQRWPRPGGGSWGLGWWPGRWRYAASGHGTTESPGRQRLCHISAAEEDFVNVKRPKCQGDSKPNPLFWQSRQAWKPQPLYLWGVMRTSASDQEAKAARTCMYNVKNTI